MSDQSKTTCEMRDAVIAAATEMFEGDQEKAEAWLQTPLKAIGYAIPMHYMDNKERVRKVGDIIGRLEHGVWT